MTTQSIIVYRNPMEQAFWETAMSWQFFAVFVGAMIGIAAVLLIDKFTHRFQWSKSPIVRWFGTYASLIGGCLVWMLVTYKLWIV